MRVVIVLLACLSTTLKRLAFPPAEQQALRAILEALQTRSWPTTQVMTTSPGGDAQISSALVYVRCQPSIDATLGAALQRALCAAHECVLSDTALTTGALRDININATANDMRKDDAYAGAGVKFNSYGDGPVSPNEAECSGGDGLGARGRCLPLDSELFHVPEPGAASKLAREILMKREHRGGGRCSSGTALLRSQQTPTDDGKVAAAGSTSGNSGAGSGAMASGSSGCAIRKRSNSFTGTDSERAELEGVCEAFAESCVVSSEMAVVDSLLRGPASANPAPAAHAPLVPTAPPMPASTFLGTDGTDEDSDSSPRRELRYAPNPNLYVMCYDASTSTSPEVASGAEEDVDSPRGPRHLPKPAYSQQGRPASHSVATGTDDKD
jgi:hypothetical protein